MIRSILIFGAAAGLIVAVPMFLGIMLVSGEGSWTHSPFFGYAIMLAAFSLIFVAVKQHRDTTGGGVIKFLPALAIGLGVSAVAGIIYVVGWEITLAATHYTFASDYAASAIAAARAKGASPEEIAQMTAELDAFQKQYADPLFRLPVTFIEIFPVGVVVSLIAAALLRNSRFLPARAQASA